jgi:hypothetical protein
VRAEVLDRGVEVGRVPTHRLGEPLPVVRVHQLEGVDHIGLSDDERVNHLRPGAAHDEGQPVVPVVHQCPAHVRLGAVRGGEDADLVDEQGAAAAAAVLEVRPWRERQADTASMSSALVGEPASGTYRSVMGFPSSRIRSGQRRGRVSTSPCNSMTSGPTGPSSPAMSSTILSNG